MMTQPPQQRRGGQKATFAWSHPPKPCLCSQVAVTLGWGRGGRPGVQCTGRRQKVEAVGRHPGGTRGRAARLLPGLVPDHQPGSLLWQKRHKTKMGHRDSSGSLHQAVWVVSCGSPAEQGLRRVLCLSSQEEPKGRREPGEGRGQTERESWSGKLKSRNHTTVAAH